MISNLVFSSKSKYYMTQANICVNLTRNILEKFLYLNFVVEDHGVKVYIYEAKSHHLNIHVTLIHPLFTVTDLVFLLCGAYYT